MCPPSHGRWLVCGLGLGSMVMGGGKEFSRLVELHIPFQARSEAFHLGDSLALKCLENRNPLA